MLLASFYKQNLLTFNNGHDGRQRHVTQKNVVSNGHENVQ